MNDFRKASKSATERLTEQVTLVNWQGRLLRAVGVLGGALFMLDGFTKAGWGDIPSLLTPQVALGLVIQVVAAMTTTGR